MAVEICSHKWDLLSLIGLLSFAAKVVPPGRTFLRRMIDLSTSLSSLDSAVTLTDSFIKDMWWHSFIELWNGHSLQLYIDSAGSVGYGAYFQGHWFNGMWCAGDMSKSIQWKELYPMVLAATTWGQLWTRRRILFSVIMKP